MQNLHENFGRLLEENRVLAGMYFPVLEAPEPEPWYGELGLEE
jgi:hypothetical protein